jgi:RNA polymerase sigma factor (TIGR02999 family)
MCKRHHKAAEENWRIAKKSMSERTDVTSIVKLASQNDPNAVAQLLPLVYEELRRLAAKYLANERSDHTLEATALVHEAYVRLVDQTQTAWKDKAHFCGVAAHVMRQILVAHARRRASLKRQPKGSRMPLDDGLVVGHENSVDLMRLDDALTELASLDERAAKVVELRFFGGMRVREVAEVLQVSDRTVSQDWAYAKAWLRADLRDQLDS